MGLTHRIALHRKNLKRDIAVLFQMDKELVKQVPNRSNSHFALKLVPGSISKRGSQLTVCIDGQLEQPNWRHKRVPVLEAKISDDGAVEFDFLQDQTLQGHPVIEHYKINAEEYVPARNQLFELLHDSLKRKDSLALVRKVMAEE